MTSDDGATTTTSEEAKIVKPPKSSHQKPRISWCDSFSKIEVAVEALSTFLPNVPKPITSDDKPAAVLLRDPDIASEFNRILRQPDAGAGDNNLCRWLYDTFQSNVPDLHLVVLRFLPVLAGVYLSRASLHKPLAGFEAVLLALYGHETAARDGNAVTVTIPDLSNTSIYHESTQPIKNDATELNMAVISPTLFPQARVKYTRRARIVGVALELYYSKVFEMPVESKIEFCDFCKVWAGEFGPGPGDADQGSSPKTGRIDLPWEILQPAFRILGHCMMWREGERHEAVYGAACGACRALHTRAQHDINPRAVLASSSLLKLAKIDEDEATNNDRVDYTEIPLGDHISQLVLLLCTGFQLLTSVSGGKLQSVAKIYASRYRYYCIHLSKWVQDIDELGPLGRVIIQGSPEYCCDIDSYSTQDFPKRNYAKFCGIKDYLALPIFELGLGDQCIGVLEFLSWYSPILLYSDIMTSLQVRLN